MATRERARRLARPEDAGPLTSSIWAARFALFSAALLISTALMHRFAELMTPAALNLFGLSFLLAAISVLISLFALISVWQTARDGTVGALVALGMAGLVLALPASLAPVVFGQAPLNDITTDTENPPEFRAILALRPRGAQSPVYAGQAAAELQAERYPDIQPLLMSRTPTEAYEIATQALTRLGLELVAEERPDGDTPGRLEAIDRTLIVGFRDDVVIRISAAQQGARIDVRSASRWGKHDFGQNAARVRLILTEIVQQLQLTVPSRS